MELGAAPLTIQQLGAIAWQRPGLTLDGVARERLDRGAAQFARLLSEGREVYGVTTGFGDSCEQHVPEEHQQELARNLVRFHGCGVGPAFAHDEARAIVAARIGTLVCGFSAVRSQVVQGLIDLLQHDVIPLIPCQGSVGASGDLTPLSYVAAALCGEGKVTFRGETIDSLQALHSAGLSPLSLRPKESLALMNGTSAMTGVAALCYLRAERLARLCCLLTAAASDVTGGQVAHFADRIFELKPHPGQRQAAGWIRQELKRERASSARIQDRYSIRCAPHIIGVLLDFLPLGQAWIETELNGVGDNPIFDPADETIYHGGNFYGGHICQAMDTLKSCVANLADLLDRQLLLCCHPHTNNGLPANLVAPGSHHAHHGFKAMQITTSALAAEAAKLTMPASVFSRSCENHNQDKVSMGTIAARDCAKVLDASEQVAAICVLAMVQAADLCGRENWGPGLSRLHTHVRRNVGPLDQDRPMDKDISWVVEALRAGQLPLAPSSSISTSSENG